MKTNSKRAKYLVYSKKATIYNPSRVWMNIAVDKLKRAAKEPQQLYYFEYDSPDKKCVFSAKATELEQQFIQKNVPIISPGTHRYSFYLDIDNGAIYSTISRNDTDEVISLTEEKNVDTDIDKSDVSEENISYWENQGMVRRNYAQMDNREKELFNIYKLAGLLSEYGYECLIVKNDKNGPDIIAFDNTCIGNERIHALHIQVKARLTIKEEYQGKNLVIAFPVQNGWYLIPHDEAIKKIVPRCWLKSTSWTEKGNYHTYKPSKDTKEKLKEFFIPYICEEETQGQK